MFWRFGGYATVSAVDAILEKSDFTLEELLEESDLIQELKAHNTKLIEYLREEPILERLLNYVVVAPKAQHTASADGSEGKDEDGHTDGEISSATVARIEAEDEEDEKEKKSYRYAYVAAEILSSDSWSLSAALLENTELLRKFWDFLKLPPPLDPLQSSYFTKVNEALLDKKTEEMLEFFKSIDGVVKHMLQHVDSPMIMDLLLKIISLEKQPGGEGIVDWLYSQDLMPILLSFLGSEHSWATQTSAGDFLKAIITISANASQNEQSCIGPNELTRQLVSFPCVEKLIADMLQGGNPLTVGVGIVIEVIRKNNSDYDPDVGADAQPPPSSHDPIYLGTLLRMFAKHVPDFMALILSPNHTVSEGGKGPVSIKRKELAAAFGGRVEPLGFDRFKTCELMAELLHCSNMGLLNELGSEEFVQARDVEREKLKAEGKLDPPMTSRRGSESEDLTMKSPSLGRTGSESPDSSRRLEVQNASEDDGFEEVSAAVDFDEKPDIEDYNTSATKPEPLSFMDQDADDFVDEPLSPFRSVIEAEKMSDPTMTVLPLSPTKDFSQDIAGLSLDKSEVAENDPSIDDEKSLRALEELTDTQIAESKAALGEESENPLHLDRMSPHPEDKPAPLFSRSNEAASAQDSASIDSSAEPVAKGPVEDDTVIHDNTADGSVIMTAAEEPEVADDSSLTPVVGDYLKQQFVEHQVVPTIIDFFFRFPWNNFLHNVVYDVVQQVFNGPMDRGFNRALAADLFETGDITMRIVTGQKKSDESQQKQKMRLGYMGHLTLIAEEVVKFTERHPPELLSDTVLHKVMNNEWSDYVEVTLSETRERDNAILGGVRPDLINPARSSGLGSTASSFGNQSSALVDAGLTGSNSSGLDGMDLTLTNGASSASGFNISGGSNILSGFGNSSDEEDEEMEEPEDEEGRRETTAVEFSRYITTPSTTTAITSSDSEPPAAPPPPPPLNVPSAARRRLAARLAMKNSSNSTAGPSDVADSTLPSTQYDAHSPSLDRVGISNPFATDEDSEEEDDASGDGEVNSFTVGDLEAEAEGKGLLPPATDLAGDEQPLSNDQLDKVEHILNVGVRPDSLHNLSTSTFETTSAMSTSPREGNMPRAWPFGIQGSIASIHHRRGASASSASDTGASLSSLQHNIISPERTDYARNRNHNAGAFNSSANPDFFLQSSDDSDSSSSDDDDFGSAGVGHDSSGSSDPRKRMREKGRRPSTTEAKRRTSLEDDDEDEDQLLAAQASLHEEEEDGELVEFRHDEMQSVDDAGK